MTRDQWLDIKQKIHDSFAIANSYTENLDPGSAEVIEFTTPQGLLQAKFIERPRVVDKKTLYAHRGSSSVRVSYTFDEHETATHLELSRWDPSASEWRRLTDASLF